MSIKKYFFFSMLVGCVKKSPPHLKQYKQVSVTNQQDAAPKQSNLLAKEISNVGTSGREGNIKGSSTSHSGSSSVGLHSSGSNASSIGNSGSHSDGSSFGLYSSGSNASSIGNSGSHSGGSRGSSAGSSSGVSGSSSSGGYSRSNDKKQAAAIEKTKITVSIPKETSKPKAFIQEETDKLIAACCNPKTTVNQIQDLINRGADLQTKDKDNKTVLMYAAQKGVHIEVYKELLKHGAAVNAKNDEDWTPLIYAVKYRRKEMVKLLLEHGADVNAIDKCDKESALINAVKNNDADSVKLLLEYKADVDLIDCSHYTPLIRAKSEKIVRLLLDHGAKVDAMIKIFDPGEKRGINRYFEVTALTLAMQEKNFKKAELLLKYNAKPSLAGKDNPTSLTSAIEGNYLEGVELLLQYKDKLDQSDIEHALSIAKGPIKDLLNQKLKQG